MIELKIDQKEVDILLDALALLESTIEKRRRLYEPISISEIEQLVKKIIIANNISNAS